MSSSLFFAVSIGIRNYSALGRVGISSFDEERNSFIVSSVVEEFSILHCWMISIFATCLAFSLCFPLTKLSLALWQGKVTWSSEAKGALQSLLSHVVMCQLLLSSGFAVIIGLCAYVIENGTALNWLLIPQMVDTLSNTIGMYFFSGATWARSEESFDSTPPTYSSFPPGAGDCRPVTSLTVEETDSQWDACVEQLSSRGFCLGELLTFYQSLTDDMPHLDSNLHTTNDIVWTGDYSSYIFQRLQLLIIDDWW